MRIVINSSSINNTQEVQLKYLISIVSDSSIQEYTLIFSVESKYAKYICDEVADGVVVILLPYAIKDGYDIESKIPITQELFYRLQYQLIPQLSICGGRKQIKIVCDTAKPNWNPVAVATAMSCGVDSYATLFEYSSITIPKDHQITHLTFFQNGAHHSGCIGHSDYEEEVFRTQLNHVKKYCEEYSKELIVITSNVDKFLSDAFWRERYHLTHTYRNIGFVLLLQKLIKIYYYSPAYNVDEFRCDLYDDSAHYERLILPNVSTDITCFYNSNGSMTRIEKIQYISKFSETHKHLLVCYAGGTNCDRCVKCRRTMLELYFTGELENYIDSFPVDEFLKHKKKHIIWFLSRRHREPVMRQISEYAKNSEKKIPWYYYILGDFRAAVAFGVKRILWRKQK